MDSKYGAAFKFIFMIGNPLFLFDYLGENFDCIVFTRSLVSEKKPPGNLYPISPRIQPDKNSTPRMAWSIMIIFKPLRMGPWAV